MAELKSGQLTHLEGNGQVGVGGVLRLGVLVQRLGADVGREEDDGQVGAEAPLANGAAEDEAALIGQLGAEDDQIRPPLLELALSIGSGRGEARLVPRRLQDRRHREGEVVLAFDDEDAALHGTSTAREMTGEEESATASEPAQPASQGSKKPVRTSL